MRIVASWVCGRMVTVILDERLHGGGNLRTPWRVRHVVDKGLGRKVFRRIAIAQG